MRTIMLAEFAAATFLESPSTGLTPMPWFVAEAPIAQGALDRMARWSLTLTLIPTIAGVVGSG